jgi:hypothetical protein
MEGSKMSNAAGGVQAKPSGLITRGAARDLSSYQYHAMTIDTDTNIDYVDTSSSGQAAGVLQNAPAAAGREAEVATEGTSLLRVDGNSVNIAAGDLLGSNSNYHGAKVTTDGAAYFCMAMEPSTADDDLIEVKLLGHGTLSAP